MAVEVVYVGALQAVVSPVDFCVTFCVAVTDAVVNDDDVPLLNKKRQFMLYAQMLCSTICVLELNT